MSEGIFLRQQNGGEKHYQPYPFCHAAHLGFDILRLREHSRVTATCGAGHFSWRARHGGHYIGYHGSTDTYIPSPWFSPCKNSEGTGGFAAWAGGRHLSSLPFNYRRCALHVRIPHRRAVTRAWHGLLWPRGVSDACWTGVTRMQLLTQPYDIHLSPASRVLPQPRLRWNAGCGRGAAATICLQARTVLFCCSGYRTPHTSTTRSLVFLHAVFYKLVVFVRALPRLHAFGRTARCAAAAVARILLHILPISTLHRGRISGTRTFVLVMPLVTYSTLGLV